jgi:sulfatase maturation enzyme AslB (radical SAM superfamily)
MAKINSVKSKNRLKIRVGPEGIHLFNRRTGINILLDEIKLPSKFWATAPRQVSVALTNLCDLNCPHCYAPKNTLTIKLDRLVKWLVDLDMNGCIGVGFGGGEPTLYPQLVELCSFVSKETNLAVTITTHAHRLSDKLLSDLKNNVNFIRVSMDGIGHTYEAIRHCSFDKLLERLMAIRNVVRFGINYVVNSRTIGDLSQAIQLASSLGASEFLLLPEELVGMGTGIDSESLKTLRKWVSQYRSNVPLEISEGHAEGFPICNLFEAETDLAAFAHIDAAGILKRTSYDISGIPIYEKGVMEALNKLKVMNKEVME